MHYGRPSKCLPLAFLLCCAGPGARAEELEPADIQEAAPLAPTDNPVYLTAETAEPAAYAEEAAPVPPAPLPGETVYAPPGAAEPTTAGSGYCPPGSARSHGHSGLHGHFARCIDHMRRTHWGYPQYFVEPPLGALVYAPFRKQIEHGMAASMVIYEYDFLDLPGGTVQLNAAGQRHLRRIAQLAEHTPFPIVIQPATQDGDVDEARQALVLAELQKLTTSVPPDRVIVAALPPIGVNGVEGQIIYSNQLRQTQMGGKQPIPTGTTTGYGMQNLPAGSAPPAMGIGTSR